MLQYKFSKQKDLEWKNLRKPNIGMFNQAMKNFDIIKKYIFFRTKDKRKGCKKI